MEHPATRSRKKLDKVYVLMARQTRARLKLVAGFKQMQFFDLLDEISQDYVRAWEKFNKLDLDKLQAARPSAKSKRSRS
jgi:hypothetical protein